MVDTPSHASRPSPRPSSSLRGLLTWQQPLLAVVLLGLALPPLATMFAALVTLVVQAAGTWVVVAAACVLLASLAVAGARTVTNAGGRRVMRLMVTTAAVTTVVTTTLGVVLGLALTGPERTGVGVLLVLAGAYALVLTVVLWYAGTTLPELPPTADDDARGTAPADAGVPAHAEPAGGPVGGDEPAAVTAAAAEPVGAARAGDRPAAPSSDGSAAAATGARSSGWPTWSSTRPRRTGQASAEPEATVTSIAPVEAPAAQEPANAGPSTGEALVDAAGPTGAVEVAGRPFAPPVLTVVPSPEEAAAAPAPADGTTADAVDVAAEPAEVAPADVSATAVADASTVGDEPASAEEPAAADTPPPAEEAAAVDAPVADDVPAAAEHVAEPVEEALDETPAGDRTGAAPDAAVDVPAAAATVPLPTPEPVAEPEPATKAAAPTSAVPPAAEAAPAATEQRPAAAQRAPRQTKGRGPAAPAPAGRSTSSRKRAVGPEFEPALHAVPETSPRIPGDTPAAKARRTAPRTVRSRPAVQDPGPSTERIPVAGPDAGPPTQVMPPTR